MTTVVVSGRHGRMSRLIASSVEATPGMTLSCTFSVHVSGGRPGTSDAIVDSLRSIPDPPFVVVDFTAREQTSVLLRDAEIGPVRVGNRDKRPQRSRSSNDGGGGPRAGDRRG